MRGLKEIRVLVTGAGGFIGYHLCRALNVQGALVSRLIRRPIAHDLDCTDLHLVDLSNSSRLKEIVQRVRPELVVHLAAVKERSHDFDDYRAGYESNLIGALNLIEACIEASSLTRFVYLGSCEEYGLQPVPFDETMRECPVSAYAVTKLSVTQFLQSVAQSHDFPAVILRPSVVYGPGQRMDMFLPALIQSLLASSQFKMTMGDQTRDFVFVEDVISAILSALTAQDLQGKVINIASAQPVRIEDIAIKVAQLIGPEAEGLLDIGGRDYGAGEMMNYWARNQRARELINWRPTTSLEDGLRKTVTYYRTVIAVD